VSEDISRRLFFAIWPDESALRRLASLRDSLESSIQGRWILTINLHLTLVFLGKVTSTRLKSLEAIASNVRAEPFTIGLDQLSWWRIGGVLCLTPRQSPQSLESLVQILVTDLKEAGFKPDMRTFRPHITLARRVGGVPARLMRLHEPICFEVCAFDLVHSPPSGSISGYETIGSWSLGGVD